MSSLVAVNKPSTKLDTIETINELQLQQQEQPASKLNSNKSESFSLVSSSGIGSSIHTNQPDLDTFNNKNASKNARVIFDTTNINVKLAFSQQQQQQLPVSSAQAVLVEANNSARQRSNSIISKQTSSTSNPMRLEPLNSRIRSAFEIFRNTFNTSTSSSSKNRNRKNKAASQHKQSSANKENIKSNNSKLGLVDMASSSSSKVIYQQKQQQQHQHSLVNQNTNTNLVVCQLCCNEFPKTPTDSLKNPPNNSHMFQLECCEHSFCWDCLRQYLKYQIIESRVSISCPQCNEKMHPNEIYSLLSLKPLPPIATTTIMSLLPESTTTATATSSTQSSPNNSNKSLLNNEQPLDQSVVLLLPPLPPPPPPPLLSHQQQNWPSLIQKYEEFMLRRVLVTIADTRWCPAPDCTYAVIASGCANCPQLYCTRPNCNTSFCYHCKQYWHPNLTCEDAALRSNNQPLLLTTTTSNNTDLFLQDLISNVSNTNNNNNNQQTSASSTNKLIRSLLQRSNSHISTTSSTNLQALAAVTNHQVLASRSAAAANDLVKEEIKRCPKCQAMIVKMDDGSCNHITCSVCGCEFCWLCMKEISDLHYLSPSGCTFWGKKPWSRKKKILWQLGTLIGAPVGIALIAGVAVPSILIGLPIWSGRKVYLRYKTLGKHKRNLIVVGTVCGAVVVAPLVAALAVGIGVPILLAYVYGVVPISLCRSGGCGLTTNNNGGVRFAFDDENTNTNTDTVGNYFNLNGLTSTAVVATTSLKSATTTTAKATSQGKKVVDNLTIPIRSAAGIADLIRTDSDLATSDYSITVPNTSFTNNGSAAMAQTPVLVTITMASKLSNNNNNNNNKGAGVSRPRKSASNRKKKSSRINQKLNALNQSNGLTLAETDSAAMTRKKLANDSSALVACGSNDRELQLTSCCVGEAANVQACGTALGAVNKLNMNMLSRNAFASESTKTKKTFSSISSSRNGQGKVICTTNTTSNNNNNNNPSIGDISIGAYTTSFSASLSGSNLYDEEGGDDDNGEEVEEDEEEARHHTLELVKTSDDDDDDDEEDVQTNLNIDLKDRDSASNIGIAGGSIKSESHTSRILHAHHHHNNNAISAGNKNNNNNNSGEKMEVKSTTTTISFDFSNKNVNASNVKSNVENDTKSISMISQKSANPSVIALAGSVKDNQSLSNFSN